MPISKSSILFYTGPLYTPFAAKIFLNESVSKIDVVALILGFMGTILINDPFSDQERGSNEVLGSIIALIGGVFIGASTIIIRLMSGQLHYTVSPFYFSLGGTCISSVLYLLSNKHENIQPIYNLETFILLVSIGAISMIGQIFIALAYENEKASKVAVFFYLQMVLIVVLDYTIFSTKLAMIEIIGGALIFG